MHLKVQMMPARFEPVERAFSVLAKWAGALLFAVICSSALAVTDTFTASGTWVAPTGTTSATVEVWGGGGGGGAATSNPSKGGGGAGGQYAKKVVTVVPGTSYAVAVGAGGSGGTVGFFSNPDGGVGGASSFASTTVVAMGGAGGTGATNGVAGTGSATGGVGDTVYAGGSGSSGTSAGAGGAGGGGAGSTGAGGAASGTTAGTGTATGGGAGGAGLSSRAGGNAGNTSGGGGGGGYATNNTDQVGGDGAGGKVLITYTLTPAVASITRASYNPTYKNTSVSWTVVFNSSVTGVNAGDFSLALASGAAGASITGVTGSGTTWTVTANTGTASAGTVTLKLVDDDSITSGGVAIGGAGTGNGNFTGAAYTLIASPCTGASDILFCDDFERSNPGIVGNGWTSTPSNTSTSCNGATGNIGCSGIDADVPPWNSISTTLRPNPSRAMFTRWATGTVDSPTVNMAGKAGAQLSFWIRRGQDTFSECPEASGENYLVQYYASNNTWKTLAQYPSSPSAALCDGRIFTPTIQLPSDALHAGFKLRFNQPSGSGDSGSGGAPNVVGYDYWHMDDVVIRELTAPSYTGAFCENFEAGLGRWSITAEGAPTTATIGDADFSTTFSQSTSHSLALRWGYVSASTFSTDLTGVSGNITYWVKSGSTSTTDPVTGEDLTVEYFNSAGTWVALATYPGSAASGTSYSATFALPADAKHANFRLRMRKLAGTGYDKSYWYVDDICVGNALASADLALTKTGGTLVPGSTTVYTLHASNNGPGTLSGSMQIVDNLPTGVSYLGASGAGWSCSANAQVVTCGWTGTLASGASAADLLLTVAVAGSVTGSVTNTAVLSGTVNDSNLSNNTASYTSGNFTPVFIFTTGTCVDGIEIGQPGQTCSLVDWSNMVAGQTKSNIYITTVNSSGFPTKLSASGATTVSLQFGMTCHDPIANAGVQASLSAATPAALPLCSGNGIEPTTQWSASKSFTFPSGSPSVATAYTFSYADVGQIELWMRNASATAQKGVSGTFVQKPAGFTLSEIKPTANAAGRCAVSTSPAPALACASLAADAARFVMAGESFSATVTALINGGGVAPNFGKEKIPEGVILNPDNVLAGMGLAPDVIGDFASFSNGVATGTDFKWDEVGIITLTPSVKDGDYLGAGDVSGTVSSNVGRFYPHHFETTLTPGCGSSFTYSGQPFAFRVAAYTSTGSGASGLTTNYNGTTGLSRVTTLSGVGSGGAITGGNVSGQPTQFSAASFTAGATPLLTDLGVLKPTFTFSPALTAAADITLRVVDTDGVTSSGASEALTNIRYGRARMFNAYGSELLDLPVSFRTEYWAGSGQGWVLNSADTCTDAAISFGTAGSSDITANTCVLEPTNNSGKGCAAPVAAATHKYLEGGVSGTDSLGVAGFAGNFNLWLKAPGATHSGSIDVTAEVPAWLKFNWTGTVGNPKARATFGVYKSPLIYRRENY